MTGATGPTGSTGATGSVGPVGVTGQIGPTGSIPTSNNFFSVELGLQQSLNHTPSGATVSTILSWMVDSPIGDYNYSQGGGLNLTNGIYTVPATGLYHVFGMASVTYYPATTESYNIQGTPMALQFGLVTGSTGPLLYSGFFSNSFASVGGFFNGNSVTARTTATLAGDVFLTAGGQYSLQVINPFIDTTNVTLLSRTSAGSFCRWAMRQFA
jgi:hypothetical protein